MRVPHVPLAAEHAQTANLSIIQLISLVALTSLLANAAYVHFDVWIQKVIWQQICHTLVSSLLLYLVNAFDDRI
jgi:hypothetical protein